MSKSQQPNAYRQRLEREALHVDEAKSRLVRQVENAVAMKFAQLYGNGKLSNLTEVDFKEIEGPTSSITLFEGTIKIKAEVLADNQIKSVEIPVQVTNSEFELDDEDFRKMVSESEAQEVQEKFNVESIEATDIEADLGEFELKDDGDDFYKIFHPALDIGRELATVSKAEYETIKDKESLFKSTLENHVVGSSFYTNEDTLKFTGSFKEPKIERHAKNLGTYKVASINEEVPEEDRLLATIGDSYRQSVEAKERAAQDAKERLINYMVNAVASQLSSLRYGSVKVASVSDSLEYSGSDFTGAVELRASLIGDEGPREIIIPLEVSKNAYKLLRPEAISQIVADGTDPRAIVADQMEKELQEKLALVDEFEEYDAQETEAALTDNKPTIKKEASDDGGTQYFGETSVLRLPKQNLGLPDDIAIGTVIYADGTHWKLTNKSDGQLSKGADDGSIYTFTKVPIQDKEPEYKLGR